MSTLDDWIADAAKALGLPAQSLTHDLRDQLLDMTRDVAHGVARVAGPLTTYLAGLAVAGGMAPSTVVSTLTELAATRAEPDGEAAEPDGSRAGASGSDTGADGGSA